MINFLDSKLLPKVFCNTTAMENYEVNNLISDNFLIKSRGFLAYTTMKPPVNIDFEFLCSIHIFYISLKTIVGTQRSSGIEIFVKIGDSNYVSVGKKILNEENGIIFFDYKKYDKNNLPPNVSNYTLQPLRGQSYKAFSNAKTLRVSIFRTEKSVPCLGTVEVWGKVAKHCSQVTKQTVEKLSGIHEISPDYNFHESACNGIPDFQIPDDFKDDLTYEIMTIPMTLPSGKTVDKLTLEKYNENEALFARKPGDPFTGLKFNESLKPILNVALKSRIDMFLLQHSDKSEVRDAKRTLGKPKKITEACDAQTKKKIKIENEEIAIPAHVKLKTFSNSENCSVPKCVKCNDMSVLYISPCNHIYCRKCLSDLCDIKKCVICRQPCTRNDVERFHE